jgi:hypothetical protein
MSSYNPPTEDLPTFNSALFNQPEETLSQAEADLLYLSKTKTDISTAPITTFNGQVDIKGNSNFGVQGVAGGVLSVNRRLRINDSNGNATGYLDFTYSNGLSAEAVYVSQSLSLTQTYHKFYNCAAGSATQVLRLTIGDTTTIPNALEVGTIGNGVSNSTGGITTKGGMSFNDIINPYTNTASMYVSGSGMNYFMNAGTTTNSQHNFWAYNNANANRIALKVGYDAVEILNGANLNAKADIVCFDKNSPNTNTLTINQNVANATYTAFAGTTTATTHTFTTYTATNLPKNSLVVTSAGATILEGLTLQTRIITSTATTSTAHQLFNNMGSGAVFTIGNALASNTINGNTTFPHQTTFGTNGVNTTPANFRTDLRIYDIGSPYTSFGQIYAGSNTLSYIMNAGATTNSFHTFSAYNNANANKITFKVGYDAVEIIDGVNLNARQIVSTTPASASHTIFTNMTAGGVLTIGNSASTNTINGNTTLPNTTTFGANTTISQSGSTSTISQTNSNGTLEFKTQQGGIPSTPLTLTSTLITLAHGTRINSSLDLWDGTLAKNANLQVLTASGDFSISNSNSGGNIVLETTDGSGLTQPVTINSTETSIATKIKLTGSSYNIAFPSQQNLGYYLRQVGSSFTTLTTNTYKTIYTTATQLGMGVWRVDWSVKNTITTAGSITQSQAFISTTSVDTNTPLVNTGAILRSHVTETYAINDIQIVASSFTLTLAVATPLYLTILKTFTTGAYSYIGEISATRIA